MPILLTGLNPLSNGIKWHFKPLILGPSCDTQVSLKTLKQKLHFLQNSKSTPSPGFRVAPQYLSTPRA